MLKTLNPLFRSRLGAVHISCQNLRTPRTERGCAQGSPPTTTTVFFATVLGIHYMFTSPGACPTLLRHPPDAPVRGVPTISPPPPHPPPPSPLPLSPPSSLHSPTYNFLLTTCSTPPPSEEVFARSPWAGVLGMGMSDPRRCKEQMPPKGKRPGHVSVSRRQCDTWQVF